MSSLARLPELLDRSWMGDFNKIPIEIFHIILTYLHPFDIQGLNPVCQSFPLITPQFSNYIVLCFIDPSKPQPDLKEFLNDCQKFLPRCFPQVIKIEPGQSVEELCKINSPPILALVTNCCDRLPDYLNVFGVRCLMMSSDESITNEEVLESLVMRTADLPILKALHLRNIIITDGLHELYTHELKKLKNLNIATHRMSHDYDYQRRLLHIDGLQNSLELVLKVDVDWCITFLVPFYVEDFTIHCSSKDLSTTYGTHLAVNATCNQQLKDVKLFCDSSFRARMDFILPKGDHCIPNFTCNIKSTQIVFVADSYDCLSCFRNVKILKNFIFRVSVLGKTRKVRLPKSTIIEYFEDDIWRPTRCIENHRQIENPQESKDGILRSPRCRDNQKQLENPQESKDGTWKSKRCIENQQQLEKPQESKYGTWRSKRCIENQQQLEKPQESKDDILRSSRYKQQQLEKPQESKDGIWKSKRCIENQQQLEKPQESKDGSWRAKRFIENQQQLEKPQESKDDTWSSSRYEQQQHENPQGSKNRKPWDPKPSKK